MSSCSVSDENKQHAKVTERALCGTEAVGALLFITYTHTHARTHAHGIYSLYGHIFRVFNVAAIL